MSCWLLAGEIILIAIMDSANIIMNYLIIKVTFTETLQRPNHRYLQIPWLLISMWVDTFDSIPIEYVLIYG